MFTSVNQEVYLSMIKTLSVIDFDNYNKNNAQ